MVNLKRKDIDDIKKMVIKEFPHDPALQEVHIARKILSKEAEMSGLTFYEYIKTLRNTNESIEKTSGKKSLAYNA